MVARRALSWIAQRAEVGPNLTVTTVRAMPKQIDLSR